MEKINYDEVHKECRWSGIHFHLMSAIELYTIKKHLKRKSGNVLDIGCGTGNFCAWFKRNNYDVVGLELSLVAIEQAKKNSNAKFVCSSAENLHFKDDIFDFVIMFDLLEHVDNYKRVLSEIKRVTRKDAIVIIKTRYQGIFSTRTLKNKIKGRELDDGDIKDGHYHVFNNKLFDEVNDYGFKVVDVRYLGQLFTPIMEMLRSKAGEKTVKNAREKNIKGSLKLILNLCTLGLFIEYFLFSLFPSSEILFVIRKE